ncbi:MAG TPA: hypothetical protein VFV72_14120 [Candidatus Limnocylindrales bacterium]|nr:hypothetical protein [Candidatus Limnocylindrales bacterium]
MNRKRLVYASRTVLIMLLIAAVVVLGLGLAIVVLGDPPEVGGWLRAVFGKVFAVVAAGLAAILGIPAAIGLWAMSGATADDAVPALNETSRKVIAGVAIAAVIITAAVLIFTGSAVRILNIGLLALVALATLGLAGGAVFSTHRGRAILSALAVGLTAAGTAWILNTAFINGPG